MELKHFNNIVFNSERVSWVPTARRRSQKFRPMKANNWNYSR